MAANRALDVNAHDAIFDARITRNTSKFLSRLLARQFFINCPGGRDIDPAPSTPFVKKTLILLD
jgi:hypothetical protein